LVDGARRWPGEPRARSPVRGSTVGRIAAGRARPRLALTLRRPSPAYADVSHVALRFDVIADDADAWSDALLDAGASSVDASDPLAGTSDEVPVFAEPGVEATGWLTVRLCALFPEHTDAQTLMAEVADTIDRAAPPFESFDVMDRDWVRATQAQFAPIRIADDFWIVPTWTAAPVDSGRNIALDPGVAFGTGSHPTTHLCLEWLRQGVRVRPRLWHAVRLCRARRHARARTARAEAERSSWRRRPAECRRRRR